MKLTYNFKDYLDATTHSLVGSSLRNWINLLVKNRKVIDWKFGARIFFITLLIFLYSPLRILERLLYDKKCTNIKVEDPIFILGYYRSGTTFMHYLMAEDPGLTYASTLEVINVYSFIGFGKLVNAITRWVVPSKRPMDNLKMSPSLPFEEEFALSNMGSASLCNGFFFPQKIGKYFDDSVMFESETDKEEWKNNFYYFLQKLSYKHKGKRLLLKTPANTARVKEILEIFPNAKFVNIYRNPYRVYLSNEGLLGNILPLLGLQKAKSENIESYIFDSYMKTYNKFIEDKKLFSRGQYAEVAYEHFVKDPLKEFERMYKELNMSHFDRVRPKMQKVLDEYKNYKNNTYEIDADLKQLIYSKWEFMFKYFNYDKNGSMYDPPIIECNEPIKIEGATNGSSTNEYDSAIKMTG